MAEKRLQFNQVPDFLTEAEHALINHTGITGTGGQTDTVTAANGIVNSGDNINADIRPVYGSGPNTIAEGDHTHPTLPTPDEKDALDNANSPTGLNPYATMADVAAGGLVDSVNAGTAITITGTPPTQ